MALSLTHSHSLPLFLSAAVAAAALNTGSGSMLHAADIPGADPTGKTDSAAALNRAVRAACDASATGRRGAVAPVGVVLDLGAGLFRLDNPLIIDGTVNCSGPVRVRDGTLVAGTLDPTRFLVEATNRNFNRPTGARPA